MRLNQIARKLGVSTDTIVSFLKKKDKSIDYKPNTKLTKTSLALLEKMLPEGKQFLNNEATAQKEINETAQGDSREENEKKEEVVSPPIDNKPIEIKTPRDFESHTKVAVTKVAVKEKKTPEKILTYVPSSKGITALRKIKLPEKKVGEKTPRKRISRTVSVASKFSKPPFKPGKKTFEKPWVRRTTLPNQGTYHKKRKEAKNTVEQSEPEIIKIVPFSTLKEVALLFDVPITTLIQIYEDLDIKVSPNQRLEAKLITLVAEELKKEIQIIDFKHENNQEEKKPDNELLTSKSPVVVVMGHVDHGKTSLLDYIKKSKITEGEAGHITQHVGAYQVKTASGREITFLDTPGHQAFTAMRARGAKITDIAIIVIAANDGVMPQTKEAIKHAKFAGIPMVFALNKIDLPTANTDYILQQLSDAKITVEEWGGKYQCQGISAKTGEGIESLLEKVLLEAEMLNLRANKEGIAKGVVVESTMKKGRGFLTTGIVQEGTLKIRDIVVTGSLFGRIKAMFTTEGKPIKEAQPAMPVQLLGINGAPPSGQTFQVVATEQEARDMSSRYKDAIQEQKLRAKHGNAIERFEKLMLEGAPAKTMNIVLKGDTDGSIGALEDSLTALSNDEIEINIIHKAVGDVVESDIILAASSNAFIVGFQTKIDKKAAVEIAKKGVKVKIYRIIYEVIDYVKNLIEKGNRPEKEETILGKADVVRVFNISRIGKVAGCIVKKGIIKRNAMMRIMRNEEEVYTNKITQLKREKEAIKEAKKDSECGISTGDFEVQEGDVILCFEIKREGKKEQ